MRKGGEIGREDGEKRKEERKEDNVRKMVECVPILSTYQPVYHGSLSRYTTIYSVLPV